MKIHHFHNSQASLAVRILKYEIEKGLGAVYIFIIIVISCEQGVGQKNNGPYTCRAENRQGRTKSNEIVLSIKCELIQLVS